MTTVSIKQSGFITRYSVAAFFVLAMVLGTGTVHLVFQGVLPASLALASALSASVAGIIMTLVEDGKIGLKSMLSRLLIWRVGIGYWLFALLFLVPAILLGSLLNPIFNGDPLNLTNMGPAFMIVPMFIGFFIVAGLGQELGWTGFLMLRLQTRFSALTSCIIRALLVGLWHLPLLLYLSQQPTAVPDFPYGGWIAQKGFVVTLGAMLFLFLVPWSIFLTWIFNNTRGSLLLVAVLHASEIWAAYWMLNAGIDPTNLDNYWGYGSFLVVIATVIVLVTGPQNLSRKHTRPMHRGTSNQAASGN